jgi:hypothetical protein
LRQPSTERPKDVDFAVQTFWNVVILRPPDAHSNDYEGNIATQRGRRQLLLPPEEIVDRAGKSMEREDLLMRQ